MTKNTVLRIMSLMFCALFAHTAFESGWQTNARQVLGGVGGLLIFSWFAINPHLYTLKPVSRILTEGDEQSKAKLLLYTGSACLLLSFVLRVIEWL